MSKNHFSVYLFLIFSVLSFYSFGTAMMDYFLLYPSRFLVGEAEFIAYHRMLESAILPVSVFPFLFITILNVALIWFRPSHVSKNLIWASLICLILDLLSTAFFQAPWNFELSEGKDVILMQKITDTNWLRVFLETVQVTLVFFTLSFFYHNVGEACPGTKTFRA
jgi:hypothetical protein